MNEVYSSTVGYSFLILDFHTPSTKLIDIPYDKTNKQIMPSYLEVNIILKLSPMDNFAFFFLSTAPLASGFSWSHRVGSVSTLLLIHV